MNRLTKIVSFVAVFFLTQTSIFADLAAMPVTTTAGTNRSTPDVSGETFVWIEGGDVFMSSLSDPNAIQISSSSKNVECRIDGDIIVWKDKSSSINWDIYTYDISTGLPAEAVVQGAGKIYYPSVSGNFIVWMNVVLGNWNVYSWDFSSPLVDKKFDVSTESAFESYCAVGNNLAVWADDRSDDWEVYARDLTDNSDSGHLITTPAQDTGDSKFGLDTDGTIIAWRGITSGDKNIYYTDLSIDPNAAINITNSSFIQDNPSVDNGVIVWEDKENDVDIYCLITSSGLQLPIATTSFSENAPRIDNNKIVFAVDAHKSVL